MTVRRLRVLVLVLAVIAAMAALATGTAQAKPAARAAKQVASVRPIPASVGHVLAGRSSSPMTTADCQAMFGINCYEPPQIQKAYNLDPLFDKGITGRGKTIVIVDAFGSPTITQDLKVFDSTYDIPAPPSFKVIQPAGAVPAYPADPFGASDRSGWAFETTLDVEWSHVMAPGANILLVETPQSETEGVQGFPQIVQAENYVIKHHLGDVISQSFGATEQTFPSAQSILDLRSAVINAAKHDVTVLGSSGDDGATDALPDLSCCYTYPVTSWPAGDPLVTGVGGTMLSLDANGNRTAPDVVWNDGYGAGGGGLSTVFERPSYQNGVQSVVGDQRGVPDISMSAAVNGAVNVYYSFTDYSQSPTFVGPEWQIVGGTSEASPLFAGVIALADQAAHHDLGFVNPLLYKIASNPDSGIVDVTSGNNSFNGVTGFNAGAGYDLASGLGTIDVAKFVRYVAERRD